MLVAPTILTFTVLLLQELKQFLDALDCIDTAPTVFYLSRQAKAHAPNWSLDDSLL